MGLLANADAVTLTERERERERCTTFADLVCHCSLSSQTLFRHENVHTYITNNNIHTYFPRRSKTNCSSYILLDIAPHCTILTMMCSHLLKSMGLKKLVFFFQWFILSLTLTLPLSLSLSLSAFLCICLNEKK